MSPHLVAETQRPLQVDPRAGIQVAEVRRGDGLANEIETDGSSRNGGGSQATAVDGDRRAKFDTFGKLLQIDIERNDASPSGRAVAFNALDTAGALDNPRVYRRILA